MSTLQLPPAHSLIKRSLTHNMPVPHSLCILLFHPLWYVSPRAVYLCAQQLPLRVAFGRPPTKVTPSTATELSGKALKTAAATTLLSIPPTEGYRVLCVTHVELAALRDDFSLEMSEICGPLVHVSRFFGKLRNYGYISASILTTIIFFTWPFRT